MGPAKREGGEAPQQQLVLQILGQPLPRVTSLRAEHWPELQAKGGFLAEKAKRICNDKETKNLPDMLPCKCINVDVMDHRSEFGNDSIATFHIQLR